MTLGLTSSGAIKIKTDGGLRAVNCACCNPCGCGGSSVNAILKEVLDNATSGTANGDSSSYWYVYGPNYWDAFWQIPIYDPSLGYGNIFYSASYSNGCFTFEAEGTGFGYLTTGTIECPPPFGDDYIYEEKTYTLNGFSFPCVSAVQKNPPGPQAPFPPPTFVFA